MHDAKTDNEKTFSIWGTGAIERVLYVDDLSRAIIYILKENINEELINIGSGEEISIHNLSLIKK